MIKKVQFISVPRVVPLDEPFPEFLEKDGVKIHTFAWNRAELGHSEGHEYRGAWILYVPVSSLLDFWMKVGPATRRGKLGYMSDVRIAQDDSNLKSIWVHLRDWKDELEVERVKDELTKLGIVEGLEYVRYREKTDVEKYDEAMERTYGPVLPRYREIIRQAIRNSGILPTLRDQTALEKSLLSLMTLYPGGFDSPIRQQEFFRMRADEFKEHEKNVKRLIKKLDEVKVIAGKLLYTQVRFPEEEAFAARLREAKIGDIVEKYLCCLCHHHLEVVEVEKEKNLVWVVCPKFKEDGNKRHTHDTWVGINRSPRAEGVFFDIADKVLQRLEGLNDALLADFQEKREALMHRGQFPDYYNARIVAQMVDAIKKYSVADLPKEKAMKFVSRLINKWPQWKGKRIGRKAVDQKYRLIREKK